MGGGGVLRVWQHLPRPQGCRRAPAFPTTTFATPHHHSCREASSMGFSHPRPGHLLLPTRCPFTLPVHPRRDMPVRYSRLSAMFDLRGSSGTLRRELVRSPSFGTCTWTCLPGIIVSLAARCAGVRRPINPLVSQDVASPAFPLISPVVRLEGDAMNGVRNRDTLLGNRIRVSASPARERSFCRWILRWEFLICWTRLSSNQKRRRGRR